MVLSAARLKVRRLRTAPNESRLIVQPETFRLFAESAQCKHIFFAGCHNTRYIPLLSPYLGKADKITLIKSAADQQEFRSLGLPIENFSSVFRDSPLAAITATPKGAVNKKAMAQPEPVKPVLDDFLRLNGATSRNGLNGPNSHGEDYVAEDWGNNSQKNSRHGSVSNNSLPSRAQRSGSISELSMGCRDQKGTKPYPAEGLRNRWASGTQGSPRVQDNIPSERPQLKKLSGAFTVADLPRLTPETEGMIPTNINGDRLDYYLPRPTAAQYAAYNAKLKELGRKPCINYQLYGRCPSLAAGLDCEYDHNTLSPELFDVLKAIVQGYPCAKQGACRKSDCYKAHVCQRRGCQGLYPCKFENDYRAHNLDLKVAEWVPAIDIAEREPGDAASIVMSDWVPEAVPKPYPPVVASDVMLDAPKWHPDSALWCPDAADWNSSQASCTPDASGALTTSFFDLNDNTWKPTVASLNSAATVWKPGQVDRSDIDSDSDIVAPQTEQKILDLGADDGNIFSPKARDGLDSIVQTASPKRGQQHTTKHLIDTSTAQANGGGGPSHDNRAYNDAKSPVLQQPEPEANLMDDDWGNAPDGEGKMFTETAEHVSFDDDRGCSKKAPAKQQQPATAAAHQQQNYGGQINNGGSHSELVWLVCRL